MILLFVVLNPPRPLRGILLAARVHLFQNLVKVLSTKLILLGNITAVMFVALTVAVAMSVKVSRHVGYTSLLLLMW